MDKSKLSTQTFSPDVAAFVKQWNPAAAVTVKEMKKTDNQPTPSTPTVEKKAVEEKKDVVEKAGSDLSSVLSSLQSTLSSLQSSMSTTTPAAKKSEEAPKDDIEKAFETMAQAMATLKQAMEKGKKTPVDSQSSSSADDKSKTPTSTETPMSKNDMGALVDTISKISAVITEMKKSQDTIAKKVDSMPNERKGVAIEKNFSEGDADEKKQEKASINHAEMLKKLQADDQVSFQEYHKYKTFGILPKKYATA